MPTTVNERAVLRPDVYRRNGAAINVSKYAAATMTRLIRSVFAYKEQGFAPDLNDLTAEKITWRRNVLTQSSNMLVSPWGGTGIVAQSAAVSPPLAGVPVFMLKEDSSTGIHRYLASSVVTAPNTTYVFSVYAKAASRSLLGMALTNVGWASGSQHVFDLANGTVAANYGNAADASITAIGGGWYRCSIRRTSAASTTSSSPSLTVQQSSAQDPLVATSTGDGVSGLYCSAAQVEIAAAATAYQAITDFTSEFLAAFPQHTLYQDANGVTPVTAAEQPVGLLLDTSKGLVANEVVANRGNPFTASTGWLPSGGSTLAIDGGDLLITNNAAAESSAIQLGAVVTGRWYEINIKVTQAHNGGVVILGGTRVAVGGVGTKRLFAVAGGNTNLAVGTNSAALGHTLKVSSISVKEIAGNHAFQTVAASRPILRQTPILGGELIVNGGFSGGVSSWVATSGGTLTPSNGKGLLTSTAAGIVQTSQNIANLAGKTVEVSCKFSNRVGNAPAIIALWSGTATTGMASGGTATEGYLKFTATLPTPHTGTLVLQISTGASGNSVEFDDVSVREVTGYRTGQNFLSFDGVDDFLVTNPIDFTATDKISLFAGVRKVSDAATAVVAEFGADSITVNGTFGLFAPSSGGATKFQFISRGAAENYAQSTAPAHAAPIAAVIRGVGTIATQRSEMYVNSVLAGKSPTGLIGAINYGNQPLYIGRRNGTSLPFGGDIYSLLAVSRITTETENLALERAIAKSMGITL